MRSSHRLPEFSHQRLDVAEDRLHILLQFLQQLARIAMLGGLAAFGAVARGGEVPILARDGGGVGLGSRS